MSYLLQALKDLGGVQSASATWTATAASIALISAPSTGKTVELHLIYAYGSAAGSISISNGTAAGTSVWYWSGGTGNPACEECIIQGADGTAMVANVAGVQAIPGNGTLHVYYRLIPSANVGQGF